MAISFRQQEKQAEFIQFITRGICNSVKSVSGYAIDEGSIKIYQEPDIANTLRVQCRAVMSELLRGTIASEISHQIEDRYHVKVRVVLEVLPMTEIITVMSSCHPVHFRLAQDLYAAGVEFCTRYELPVNKLRVYYSVSFGKTESGYPRAYLFDERGWSAHWEVVPMGRINVMLYQLDRGLVPYLYPIFDDSEPEIGDDEEAYARLVSLGLAISPEQVSLRRVDVNLPIGIEEIEDEVDSSYMGRRMMTKRDYVFINWPKSNKFGETEKRYLRQEDH